MLGAILAHCAAIRAKDNRVETARLNLQSVTEDPDLLKRVITGDESWIYGFNAETSRQSSEWRFPNEPRTKKITRIAGCDKVAPFRTLWFQVVLMDFVDIWSVCSQCVPRSFETNRGEKCFDFAKL